MMTKMTTKVTIEKHIVVSFKEQEMIFEAHSRYCYGQLLQAIDMEFGETLPKEFRLHWDKQGEDRTITRESDFLYYWEVSDESGMRTIQLELQPRYMFGAPLTLLVRLLPSNTVMPCEVFDNYRLYEVITVASF